MVYTTHCKNPLQFGFRQSQTETHSITLQLFSLQTDVRKYYNNNMILTISLKSLKRVWTIRNSSQPPKYVLNLRRVRIHRWSDRPNRWSSEVSKSAWHVIHAEIGSTEEDRIVRWWSERPKSDRSSIDLSKNVSRGWDTWRARDDGIARSLDRSVQSPPINSGRNYDFKCQFRGVKAY